MTQAEFLNYNSDNISKPEASEGFDDPRFITKIPGPDQPLIVKLLPNPNKPSEGYISMNYYTFAVGSGPKDVRQRPSLQSLGVVEKDPENEKKWTYINKMKALKSAGITKNDPQFKAVFEAKKKFEPKTEGWVHVIEPGKNTIRCMKLKQAMINTLFGREATQDSAAIPSLIENLSKRGKSPYKLQQEDCWLKVYKTGEGLGTRYHIEACQITEIRVIDGNEVEMKRFETFPVFNDFKEGRIAISSLPDPIAFEKRNAFSLEETMQFIESDGVVFPPRFAPRARNNASKDDATPVGAESNAAAAAANYDDIPF